MKVKINKKGVMKIFPTTEKEDFLLYAWYLKNKKRIVNQTIIFERFKTE